MFIPRSPPAVPIDSAHRGRPSSRHWVPSDNVPTESLRTVGMAKEKSAKKGAAASRLPTLAAKRAKIDRIDQEIIKLMNQRAQVAHEIGKLKTDCGMKAYAPAREEEVLARVE